MSQSKKNLIDMVSDFALQLTLKKLPSAVFLYSIKEEYPQLFEKSIKIPLSFPTTYMCEVKFSS